MAALASPRPSSSSSKRHNKGVILRRPQGLVRGRSSNFYSAHKLRVICRYVKDSTRRSSSARLGIVSQWGKGEGVINEGCFRYAIE